MRRFWGGKARRGAVYRRSREEVEGRLGVGRVDQGEGREGSTSTVSVSGGRREAREGGGCGIPGAVGGRRKDEVEGGKGGGEERDVRVRQ